MGIPLGRRAAEEDSSIGSSVRASRSCTWSAVSRPHRVFAIESGPNHAPCVQAARPGSIAFPSRRCPATTSVAAICGLMSRLSAADSPGAPRPTVRRGGHQRGAVRGRPGRARQHGRGVRLDYRRAGTVSCDVDRHWGSAQHGTPGKRCAARRARFRGAHPPARSSATSSRDAPSRSHARPSRRPNSLANKRRAATRGSTACSCRRSRSRRSPAFPSAAAVRSQRQRHR